MNLIGAIDAANTLARGACAKSKKKQCCARGITYGTSDGLIGCTDASYAKVLDNSSTSGWVLVMYRRTGNH